MLKPSHCHFEHLMPHLCLKGTMIKIFGTAVVAAAVGFPRRRAFPKGAGKNAENRCVDEFLIDR